jgi:hypothetical protein
MPHTLSSRFREYQQNFTLAAMPPIRSSQPAVFLQG